MGRTETAKRVPELLAVSGTEQQARHPTIGEALEHRGDRRVQVYLPISVVRLEIVMDLPGRMITV